MGFVKQQDVQLCAFWIQCFSHPTTSVVASVDELVSFCLLFLCYLTNESVHCLCCELAADLRMETYITCTKINQVEKKNLMQHRQTLQAWNLKPWIIHFGHFNESEKSFPIIHNLYRWRNATQKGFLRGQVRTKSGEKQVQMSFQSSGRWKSTL